MSRFTEAGWIATGERRNGRPTYCLTTPLAYEVGYLGSGWTVTAPEGFCTDLASLPSWLARTGFGRDLGAMIARSAVVHDVMRADARWPKLLSDYVFLEAMAVDGVPALRRWACFVAALFNFSRY